MGAAMRNAPLRYFFVEHPVMMLIAIAIAHVGAARVRKVGSDSAKFQTATIWFGVALAALLVLVPWARPLIPSF
jgi:hypothetical protein